MRNDGLEEDQNKPWGKASSQDRLGLSRTLLSIMKDGVFFADANLRVRYANPSFARTSGLDSFTAEPPQLRDLYPEPMNDRALSNARVALESVGFWTGELMKSRQTGRQSVEEVRMAVSLATTSPDGSTLLEEAPRYVGVVRDVSDEREALERLAWSRNHDELTGLPNRPLFSAAIDSVIKRSDGSNSYLVVVSADIDDFKRYNTDFGYECGDMLLRAVGKRIASTVRAGDISARTAGDEFAVLMAVSSLKEAEEASERVQSAFKESIKIDDERCFPLRASLGVSIWPRDGSTAAELLAAADIALQACKDAGRGCMLQFSENLCQDRRGRSSLETDLSGSLDAGQLSVHYQPVIRVSTGSVDSVEALVRWNHPIRGNVSPCSFIPLAEETGLIVRLGEMVMRSACKQGGAWAKNEAELKVSVNVSPVQLRCAEFPVMLAELLESTGLPPERLIVEITESVLLERFEDAALGIARLKNLGVMLSVDDFGTGYCSLTYLKNLPIDIVKIDREFIKDIEKSTASREIVMGIIGLAHRMKLSVVAEGVETAEQYYLLKNMQCDHAQGFLFSQAIPPLEFEERYMVRGCASRYSTFLFRR
ncbi:MAG: EAL domain-containing protein [Spirochaetia bacterium]|jgi:diguanylate cyclase (GGDEF)-like protein|nr:EAL domain-containing protein [Spirochaetia bacterium]